jgi:hypothetical protein
MVGMDGVHGGLSCSLFSNSEHFTRVDNLCFEVVFYGEMRNLTDEFCHLLDMATLQLSRSLLSNVGFDI